MAKKPAVSADVQKWINQITAYEREFGKWEKRVDKILKRYRGEDKSKFNILWANVQTLSAATFAKLPKPDVSRRFKDQDPTGRVASLLLERALEYEIQKYTDYQATLRSCIYDRFLGGRGTAWVRYEPHFRAAQLGLPENGLEISEDIDEPQEQLDYECAPCDYVHWKDFGHVVARTWEEVPAVWRKVYLTREQCISRFGDEGEKIPLDAIPEDFKNKETLGAKEDDRSRACIYEIWDKTTKTAYWISKSLKQMLDQQDDPLGLEEFFPCPRPLFATLTNDSLVPVPDFTLYQDKANTLDTLSERVQELSEALKVRGVYNAEHKELQRLFTEGENNMLIPVKNWAAFSEKAGLKGAVDIVDIAPIAAALREAYSAIDQVKGQIYEITGVADIIRGQTDPNETLGAQQLKGQYASLRLRSYQEEVSRFASELLQIKAQIICGKFAPQTIGSISAANQLNPVDQQILPQAMALLIGEERIQNPDAPQGENPLRSFRVEVSTDTLVYIDEEAEKKSRIEFLTATGGFIEKAVQASQASSQIVPLLMEMMKFGVTAFKVGKSIEGVFDETAEKIKQEAANPQPRPDPEMAKVQAQQQIDQQRLQFEQQSKQMDIQMEERRIQMEAAAREREQQSQAAIEQHRNELEAQRQSLKDQHNAQVRLAEIDFEKWKEELHARTQIEVAEISAKATLQAAQSKAAKQAAEGGEVEETVSDH